MKPRLMLLLVLFVPLVLTAACSDDPTSPQVTPVGCRLHSDCEIGFVCEEGACVEVAPCEGEECPCASDAECGSEAFCRAGECLPAECEDDTGCGLGQVCVGRQCLTDLDADRDRDGTPDAVDNCPMIENADQEDADHDGSGDACDVDDDDDGVLDDADNCPLAANTDQTDHNGDGVGNACDSTWQGTTVVGRLVPIGLEAPDFGAAEVTLSGLEAPVTPTASGDFAFDHAVQRGGPVGIQVRWPGFSPTSIVADVPNGVDRHSIGEVEVFAATDATLEGRVTLVGQSSHTGITVVVQHRDGRPFATLATDPEGRFVTQATREPFTLAFYREGYLPLENVEVAWDPADERFEVEEAALVESPFTLEALRAGSVRGRLASPLGEGFPWDTAADVRLIGATEHLGIVQSNGDFAIDGLAPGFYTLRVVVDAHAPRTEPVRVETGEVDLGVLSLDPALDDAQWLRGRAVLDGAEVHDGIVVRARIADSLFLVDTTLTDAYGAFAMPLSRSPFDLELSADGYRTRTVQTIWSDANERFEFDHDQDVATAPVPLSEHTLVLEADATVSLTGLLRSPRAGVQWTADAEVRLYGANVYFGVVQPGGEFQVTGLTPGAYLLVVDVAGHETWSDSITLTAGANMLDAIDLELERVALVGAVRLAEQSAPDAHGGVGVVLQRDEFVSAVTVSSATGVFSAEIPSTRHTVVLSLTGYVSRQIAVLWDGTAREFMFDHDDDDQTPVVPLVDTPIVLQVDRTVSAMGSLRSPLPNVQWAVDADVTLGGLDTFTAIVAPDGRFSTTDVRPGEYTLTIRVAGHRTVTRGVRLVSGPNDLGAFDLEPDEVSVRGFVQLEGETDHGLAVIRARRDGVIVATTESGASGEFVLRITRSTHELSLSKPGFVSETITILWDTADERFEFESTPLEERPLLLQRAADGDRDNDGVLDVVDNCLSVSNISQRDIDGDGLGDACDEDIDEDGLVNGFDNCPISFNPMQEDPEGAGRGAACAGVDAAHPLLLPAGVHRQHLDTRARTHALRGTCGGANTPELVYGLDLVVGQEVHVEVEADFNAVLYLIDRQEVADPLDDVEVGCQASSSVDFTAPGSGSYLLVVDGLLGGDLSAGQVVVNVVPDGATYFGRRALPTLEGPSHVAVGDLDEDGFPDLAVAHEDPALIRVFLGGPDAVFEAPLVLDLTGPPFSVNIADIDGDGHLDLVIGVVGMQDYRHGEVGVYKGDGTGAFGRVGTVLAGQPPVTTLVADVTGDDRVDLLHVDEEDLILSRGQADGSFRGAVPFHASTNVSTAADLDGDGHDELIAGGLRNVIVRRGRGQGQYGEASTWPVPFSVVDVVAVDLNGDGHLDIAASGDQVVQWSSRFSGFNSGTAILTNDGTGAAFRTDLYETGGRLLTPFDFNRDGIMDLAVVGNRVAYNNRNTATSPAEVSILPGRGDGTFKDMLIRPEVETMTGARSADLDGDGLAEVVAITRTGADHALTVHRWTADGRFDAVLLPIESGVIITALTIADVDGDGLSDLITIGTDGVGRVIQVHRTLADGSFASGALFRGAATFGLLQATDVTGDGLAEVVYADTTTGANAVVVHVQSPDGSFGEGLRTPTPNAITRFTIVDVDGDGVADVTCHLSGSSLVRVLSGAPDGVLLANTADVTVQSANDMTLADLDADGRIDLLTARSNTSAVEIRYGIDPVGDPAVRFDAAVSHPVGVTPEQLIVTNLDDGAIPDVVVRTRVANQLSVLFGEGARTFTHQPITTDLTRPTSLVVRDLDGDGHLDLVTALGTNPQTISTVRGHGDRTFEPPSLRALPYDIDVDNLRDLDGDGLVDAIRPDAYGGTHVMWGTGDSLWASAEIPHDTVVATADLDDDGLPDFVLAEAPSSSTQIHLSLSSSSTPWYRDASIVLAFTGRVRAIEAAELNGDGAPDLALVGTDQNLRLMLSAGPLTFDFAVVPLGALADGIAPVDIDGDLDEDLVLNFTDDSGRIYLNDGAAGFTLGQTFESASDVTGLRGVDLSEDGLPDLLMSGLSGGAMLFGDGAGIEPAIFRPRVPGGSAINGAVVADFDGDDRVDVAVSDVDQIAVWLGDAVEVLRLMPPVELDDDLLGLQHADLDDDGHADLIAVTWGVLPTDGQQLHTLRGVGDGTFEPARFIQAFPHSPVREPIAIAVADVDADGRDDVLVPSGAANRIDLVLDVDGEPAFDHVWLDGEASTLGLADLDQDGRVDAVVPGHSAPTVNLLLNQYGPSRLPATHYDDQRAAPCDALTLDGVRDGQDWVFTAPLDPRCRVTRLELDLPWTDAPADPVAELIAEDAASTFGAAILVDATAPLAPSGRWSPDLVHGLARFEGTLLGGTWRLRTNLGCTNGQCLPRLLVNRAVPDPLTNPDCDSALTPGFAEEACVWDGSPLVVDLDADTDTLLLLAVDADGGAPAAATLQVIANTPDDIVLELLPLGAREALATGTTAGDGLWEVSAEVPLAFADRYFAVRLRSPFGGTRVSLEAP